MARYVQKQDMLQKKKINFQKLTKESYWKNVAVGKHKKSQLIVNLEICLTTCI